MSKIVWKGFECYLGRGCEMVRWCELKISLVQYAGEKSEKLRKDCNAEGRLKYWNKLAISGNTGE